MRLSWWLQCGGEFVNAATTVWKPVALNNFSLSLEVSGASAEEQHIEILYVVDKVELTTKSTSVQPEAQQPPCIVVSMLGRAHTGFLHPLHNVFLHSYPIIFLYFFQLMGIKTFLTVPASLVEVEYQCSLAPLVLFEIYFLKLRAVNSWPDAKCFPNKELPFRQNTLILLWRLRSFPCTLQLNYDKSRMWAPKCVIKKLSGLGI